MQNCERFIKKDAIITAFTPKCFNFGKSFLAVRDVLISSGIKESDMTCQKRVVKITRLAIRKLKGMKYEWSGTFGKRKRTVWVYVEMTRGPPIQIMFTEEC